MQFTNDIANRILRRGHAKENLDGAGVILIEPAFERSGRGRVAAFERFKNGNGRRKSRVGDSLVQWKFSGGKKLPEDERET